MTRGALTRRRVLAASAAILLVALLYFFREQRGFYRDEFEWITGTPLPDSAHFLKKETGGYDIHGDHDTCAVVEMSEADYARMQTLIQTSPPSDPKGDLSSCTLQMYQYLSGFGISAETWSRKEGGWVKYWALVKGRPLVIIEYSSW